MTRELAMEALINRLQTATRLGHYTRADDSKALIIGLIADIITPEEAIEALKEESCRPSTNGG